MAKKYALLFLVAVLAVVIVNFSVTDTGDSLVLAYSPECSTVDKAAGDPFTVKISFKNTGKTTGTWSINIAFEDSAWSQTGTAQNLTLRAGQTQTLVWNGFVPENATLEILIERFQEADPALIVELNGRYIYAREYSTTRVSQDDRVEFIHPDFGG